MMKTRIIKFKSFEKMNFEIQNFVEKKFCKFEFRLEFKFLTSNI